MGLKFRRKIIRVGSSAAITLPPLIAKGKEASLAADRLILIDPTGKISEDDLLEFLETHVEPLFWNWLRERAEGAARTPKALHLISEKMTKKKGGENR